MQSSILGSSPGRSSLSRRGLSPTPSLRPFDRRFRARISPSPLGSPRALSPGYLTPHSRQSSVASRTLQGLQDDEVDTPESAWEVIRWTRLKKLSGQAFSEKGKRSFGRPTCIIVSASIILGTSRGIILVFDYHQNLKTILGPGTKGRYSYNPNGCRN